MRRAAQDVLGDEATAVTGDKMMFMYSDTGSVSIPEMLIPPTLHNDGNYIISLGIPVRSFLLLFHDSFLGQIHTTFQLRIIPKEHSAPVFERQGAYAFF